MLLNLFIVMKLDLASFVGYMVPLNAEKKIQLIAKEVMESEINALKNLKKN